MGVGETPVFVGLPKVLAVWAAGHPAKAQESWKEAGGDSEGEVPKGVMFTANAVFRLPATGMPPVTGQSFQL